jgi:hypothetical protein
LPVRARSPRAPRYDARVVAALEKRWAVANAPAGKRLAQILAELLPVLRRHSELLVDDEVAALLVGIVTCLIIWLTLFELNGHSVPFIWPGRCCPIADPTDADFSSND